MAVTTAASTSAASTTAPGCTRLRTSVGGCRSGRRLTRKPGEDDDEHGRDAEYGQQHQQDRGDRRADAQPPFAERGPEQQAHRCHGGVPRPEVRQDERNRELLQTDGEHTQHRDPGGGEQRRPQRTPPRTGAEDRQEDHQPDREHHADGHHRRRRPDGAGGQVEVAEPAGVVPEVTHPRDGHRHR
jgi:hypothetical protein